MRLFLFEIYKQYLTCRGRDLSKLATHYSPLSGFPYYKLDTSNKEGTHYLAPGGRHTEQLCEA